MELLFDIVGEAGFKLVIEEGKTREEDEDKDESVGPEQSSSDGDVIKKVHRA